MNNNAMEQRSMIRRLQCQNQLCFPWINNSIRKYSSGCNFLSMPFININILVHILAYWASNPLFTKKMLFYRWSDDHLRFIMGIPIPIRCLTHWDRVCVSELTIIVSDNGLSPGRRQAIIWTNAGIFLIGPYGINSSEILIAILTFHSRKWVWKCRLRNGGHFVSASMC